MCDGVGKGIQFGIALTEGIFSEFLFSNISNHAKATSDDACVIDNWRRCNEGKYRMTAFVGEDNFIFGTDTLPANIGLFVDNRRIMIVHKISDWTTDYIFP